MESADWHVHRRRGDGTGSRVVGHDAARRLRTRRAHQRIDAGRNGRRTVRLWNLKTTWRSAPRSSCTHLRRRDRSQLRGIAGGKGWDAAVVEQFRSPPGRPAATTNGLDPSGSGHPKLKSRFSSSPHGSTRGHAPRAPTISPITGLSHQAICGSTRAEIGGTYRPAISMRKAWASTRTWSPSTGKSAAPARPRLTAS